MMENQIMYVNFDPQIAQALITPLDVKFDGVTIAHISEIIHVGGKFVGCIYTTDDLSKSAIHELVKIHTKELTFHPKNDSLRHG